MPESDIEYLKRKMREALTAVQNGWDEVKDDTVHEDRLPKNSKLVVTSEQMYSLWVNNLVKGITGKYPDKWPEKWKGMTIEELADSFMG